MREEKPLVSVLVLCYNNQKYIYENLRSIFGQTYPNIEVLIADDASENFAAGPLINWINKYRTKNIKKVSIYENPENIGTVASLENLQQHSSGEYLFNIAADDVLYDEHVIERFYNRAMEVGEDAEIFIAQTEMWDNTLKTKLGDFLDKEAISFIKKGTPRQIFSECSWHPFLPACYFYRRSLIKKIGVLAGKYALIEDWPAQLIVTRQGVQPYYVDMISSIKHRDGGISHGNSAQSKATFLKYYRDFISVYTNEVEPYKHMLSEDAYLRARQYNQDRVRAYYTIHIPAYQKCLATEMPIRNTVSPKEIKVDECKENSTDKTVQENVMCHWRTVGRTTVKRYAYILSKKKVMLMSLAITLLAFAIAILCRIHSPHTCGTIATIIACTGGTITTIETGIYLILKYRRKWVWGK